MPAFLYIRQGHALMRRPFLLSLVVWFCHSVFCRGLANSAIKSIWFIRVSAAARFLLRTSVSDRCAPSTSTRSALACCLVVNASATAAVGEESPEAADPLHQVVPCSEFGVEVCIGSARHAKQGHFLFVFQRGNRHLHAGRAQHIGRQDPQKPERVADLSRLDEFPRRR